MKNKYQITIKNLESGEVEVDAETSAVAGALTVGDRLQCVCLTECNGIDMLAIIGGLKSVLNKLETKHPELALFLRITQLSKNSNKKDLNDIKKIVEEWRGRDE